MGFAMRPQVAVSGRVGSWDVYSVAGVSAMAVGRQGRWEPCGVRVGRSGLREWKRRQEVVGNRLGLRFAAMSGSEAAEVGVIKNSGEGGGSASVGREEGLLSSVGTPAPAPVSFRDWYLADKQLVVMSLTAIVTAGLMGILVAAAIPSLLAIKKAAEALEKLAETAREELPGTMAAIRLSGMEISDLTMELNDLGQEISRGVRSSARVLSSAETGMRQAGGIASNVWQVQAVVPAQAVQPLVARTARKVRDSLVQTRTLVRNLQVLSRVSGWIGSLQGRAPVLIIPSDEKKHKS